MTPKQAPLWSLGVTRAHAPQPCLIDQHPHALSPPAVQHARLKLKLPLISPFIDNARFPPFFFISPTLFLCLLTLPFPSGSRGSFTLITKLLFTPTDGDRHTSDTTHHCFPSILKQSAQTIPPPHHSACTWRFCPLSWSPDDWRMQSSISAFAKLRRCL